MFFFVYGIAKQAKRNIYSWKDGFTRCRCEQNFESGTYTKSGSEKPSIHCPTTFSYVAVASTGKIILERLWAAENDTEAITNGSSMFIKQLIADEPYLKDVLKQDSTPPPTAKQITNFLTQTACVICKKDFDWEVF